MKLIIQVNRAVEVPEEGEHAVRQLMGGFPSRVVTDAGQLSRGDLFRAGLLQS